MFFFERSLRLCTCMYKMCPRIDNVEKIFFMLKKRNTIKVNKYKIKKLVN